MSDFCYLFSDVHISSSLPIARISTLFSLFLGLIIALRPSYTSDPCRPPYHIPTSPIFTWHENYWVKLNLTEIPTDIPTDTREIVIECNPIIKIEDDAFVNLSNLEVLSLRKNELVVLCKRAFRGLNSLRTLLLEGNHLTTLPEDVFSHLPRPIQLGVSDIVHRPLDYRRWDNPMECGPELCWLKEEEIQGTITWFATYSWYHHRPMCKRRGYATWRQFSCDEPGNLLLFITHEGRSCFDR